MLGTSRRRRRRAGKRDSMRLSLKNCNKLTDKSDRLKGLLRPA